MTEGATNKLEDKFEVILKKFVTLINCLVL